MMKLGITLSIFLAGMSIAAGHANLREGSCGQVAIRFRDGRTRRIDHCMIALRRELNDSFKVDVKVEPYFEDSYVLKTIYLDSTTPCDDDFIEGVLDDVQREITRRYRRHRNRIRTCLRNDEPL